MGTLASRISRTYGTHEATHVNFKGEQITVPYNLCYNNRDLVVYTYFIAAKPNHKVMLKTYYIPSKRIISFKLEVHRPIASNRMITTFFTKLDQIKTLLLHSNIQFEFTSSLA